jgi:O-antigen/teichoic acid export membrane protein
MVKQSKEAEMTQNKIKNLKYTVFDIGVIFSWFRLKQQAESFEASFRNFIYMLTIQAGNYLLPLLVVPLVAQKVGVENWGKLEHATSLIIFCSVFINFGFNHFGTQEVAESRATKTLLTDKFNFILNAKLLLFIASSICAFLLLGLRVINIEFKLFLFTYLICIGHLVNPTWFFLGIEKSAILSLTSFFIKIIEFVLVIQFILGSSSYHYFNLILSTSYIVASGACFWYAIKKYKLPLELIPLKDTFHYIKLALPAAITEFAAGINSAGTIVLLGAILSTKQVGIYTAAIKIIFVIQSLAIIPFSQSFFPRFSRTAENNPKYFWQEFCTVGTILFISFGSLSFLIFNYANFLISYLFGAEFHEAITILQVLSFLPFAIALNNMISYQGLLAFKKYNTLTTITIATSLLSLALTIVMLPHFHLISVAYIRIAVQILTAGVSLLFLIKTVKKALV